MAEEVMRELDEANAVYFTLNVNSATSLQVLEIPATFTAKTGWPGGEDCSLVTSISTLVEWPLRLRSVSDTSLGVSAVSVGAGWPKFVHDQDISHGAFLIFEVVDELRLVVAIHRCSGLAHAASQQKPSAANSSVRVYREPPSNLHRVPCLSSRADLNADAVDALYPHFLKTLRKTHTKKFASNKMDAPAAYWRAHGVARFDGVWYKFNGPLSLQMVKTATNTWGKQTFCSFTEGWAGFCASNRLKVGDSLLFCLVGPAEFLVMKV